MLIKNKLTSNFPRGPIKANDSTNEDWVIKFEEDHDYNVKVSHIYEFESNIHDGALKRFTIDGIHSGLTDDSWFYLALMYAFLVGSYHTNLYETRKLLFYSVE